MSGVSHESGRQRGKGSSGQKWKVLWEAIKVGERQHAQTHWQWVGGTNQHLEYLKLLIPSEEKQLELRNQRPQERLLRAKTRLQRCHGLDFWRKEVGAERQERTRCHRSGGHCTFAMKDTECVLKYESF